MKHKYTFLTGLAITIATSTFAQSIESKIDKHAKDSKRAQNAAKADVYISNNKSVIADTATFGSTSKATSQASKSTKATAKKKSIKKSKS